MDNNKIPVCPNNEQFEVLSSFKTPGTRVERRGEKIAQYRTDLVQGENNKDL